MIHRSLSALPWRAVSHNSKISKRVFLENGETPGITQIARAVFPVGEIAPSHCHSDMWEAFICESGVGTIDIDGASHGLSPGVCAVVGPGEYHEVANSGDGELVVTVIGISCM